MDTVDQDLGRSGAISLAGELRRALAPSARRALLDCAAAGAFLASARLARTSRADVTGAVLAASAAALGWASATQKITIGARGRARVTLGAAAVAAPLVLGYARRDRLLAAMQITAGVGLIAASLATDYLAERDVGRTIRRARSAPGAEGVRVPEVQRPLEGLSAPSALPPLDV